MRTAEGDAKEDFVLLRKMYTKQSIKELYTPRKINEISNFMLKLRTAEYTETYWKEFERLLKEE